MARPTSRVLALLELLQTHGRMSGVELARRLDVDVRTLRRYITTLEDIGIPITAERGRYGAYALVAGFKLPPLMFTADETLAISLGLLASRHLGLAESAPAIASVEAKLERVMPANLKSRVRAARDTVTLDLSEGLPARDNAALTTLTMAAQERRRARVEYRSATGEITTRSFDVYGLVYREASWYATGFCHLRNELRSFRVDRMRNVTLLNETFERPEDFDAMKYLTASIATIPRAFAVEVLLHTDLQTAVQALHESLGLFEARDDAVLLRSRTDSIDWFARQLARLPFTFEIHTPGGLRDALRAHCQRLMQRHSG